MCYSTNAIRTMIDPQIEVKHLYRQLRDAAKSKPQPMLLWGDVILLQEPYWYDWVIRWRLMSEWNHSAIYAGFNRLFEARGSGVKYNPLDRINKRRVMILRPRDQEKHGLTSGAAFAEKQLGLPYDWYGIAGFALNKDSADYGKRWFCFELTRALLEEEGYEFPRYEHPLGITSSEYFILHPHLAIIWEGTFKL